MKKIQRLCCMGFLFMMSGNILAQQTGEFNAVKHYTNVADSYLQGLNEQDLDGILSLYADSATVEDPVGSKVVEGMEAIRKFYSGAVTMDLNLERIGAVRIAGNEIAFPFQLIMKVDGKLTKTEIIDVFKFDAAGKIISMWAFWGPSNRSEVKE